MQSGTRQSGGAPFLGGLGASPRAVVRELLMGGPLTRAELARRLQLSPAALTQVTRDLLEAGVLISGVASPPELRGRPGVPMSVDVGRIQLIGVKLTGDGLFAVRTDAAGTVLASERTSLASTSVSSVVPHIVEMVNELAAGAPVQAVGIGVAGTMTRFDDHVRDSIYLDWDRVPLAVLVEDGCGLPTVIGNDVRALAAGMQWWGPGRSEPHFAVVTTGVGVGVGLVLDGRVVVGAGGRAGMVGHHLIDGSGPLCELGHRGCVAALLITDALVRSVSAAHGERLTDLSQVCELADAGDAPARRAIDDAGAAAGALIADLVDLIDVPLVILSGDGLPVTVRALPRLRAELDRRLDPHARRPRLEIYESDFDDWARGAAVVGCQWLLDEPASPRTASRHPQDRSKESDGNDRTRQRAAATAS